MFIIKLIKTLLYGRTFVIKRVAKDKWQAYERFYGLPSTLNPFGHKDVLDMASLTAKQVYWYIGTRVMGHGVKSRILYYDESVED